MNIKSESRMLSYLEKRIKAQERLLIAYRIGSCQVPNITLDALSATRDWKAVLKRYREIKHD